MMHSVAARVCVAVVVGAMAVQLTGCTKTILPDKTQSTVADFVANNSPSKYRPTDVSCPSGIKAKVGTEFDCHFTGPDGAYTAHLKITSVNGTDVMYDIQTFKTSS
jgi:Domain of unknown function (DUF4333)